MAEERFEEIRQTRLERRAALLSEGKDPYPAEARRTHTIAEAQEAFDGLKADSVPLVLAGRVMSVRRHGGVAFVDLRDASGLLQLQFTKDEIAEEFFEGLGDLDVGDVIQASGLAGTTQRGVDSLMVTEWHYLVKSVRPLPSSWHGLKDHEQRFRLREVDVLMNDEVRETLTMRSRILTWLRQYFAQEGYLEVETPILHTLAGGAAAKPFETHHNALGIPLYLRIAAELHLKRLIVGGYEKVYEIERRFRNEGISKQHNPEFTMLESQWAYADYEDIMDFTDEMMHALCTDLLGTTTVMWQGHELSFEKPLKRVRYVELVSEKLGFDILEERDVKVYQDVFAKHKLATPETTSYYQLVDELYKALVRPELIEPTQVYDYPAEMVPLAKPSAQDPRVAEKVQLLVAGLEITNCYTEQNDPVAQREAFEYQATQRDEGDDEAHVMDEEYVRALEYGMPPNAGLGLGVDRLVMLLTDSPTLRDTIAFPLLRPEKLEGELEKEAS